MATLIYEHENYYSSNINKGGGHGCANRVKNADKRKQGKHILFEIHSKKVEKMTTKLDNTATLKFVMLVFI